MVLFFKEVRHTSEMRVRKEGGRKKVDIQETPPPLHFSTSLTEKETRPPLYTISLLSSGSTACIALPPAGQSSSDLFPKKNFFFF